jgi:hypothetical protein
MEPISIPQKTAIMIAMMPNRTVTPVASRKSGSVSLNILQLKFTEILLSVPISCQYFRLSHWHFNKAGGEILTAKGTAAP